MRGIITTFAFIGSAFLLSACAKPPAISALETTYTSPASQFITLKDGTRVHVRDEGKKDGPNLVLLHGSNASLHTWEPWVARLGPDYRIISLDFPGHGLTGPNPQKDYSSERYVAVVDEVTSRLGAQQFSLAGNSMGGGVAWRFALAHPQRVQSLILVDAAGYPFPARGSSIFSLIRTPVIGEFLSGFATKDLYRSNLENVFVDKTKVTDAMVQRYFDLNSREGNPQATLARLRSKPAKPDAWKDIRSINAPTLILWGDKDTLIPVANADRFAADLPVAEKIIYPNVGHVPMEEIPDQTARDVGAFLDALIGREPPPGVKPRIR
jgi:pimeloyl-ACP methyl ester carboxylesterase